MQEEVSNQRLSFDTRIEMVKDTLKFQGVEIKDIDIDKDCPVFKVKINKSKISKDLDYVLNFTYWAIWSLLYGKYSEDKVKKYKLELLYDV